MSRAELSLEISRLVSRLLKGESIDLADKAEELAARFPDLGMTADMIGSAIERAATMVDKIRNRPEPLQATATPDYPDPVETANGDGADHVNGDVEGMQAIEMPRAAALSEFTFEEASEHAATNGNGHSAHANSDDEPLPDANAETTQPPRSRFASGAITSLRRALFRN